MNIITYSLVNQTNFSDLHMHVQKGGGGKEGKNCLVKPSMFRFSRGILSRGRISNWNWTIFCKLKSNVNCSAQPS